MASSSKQRQPFVQLDNFLFSDDDASEQPELIQGAASDHEVVPDSSDEASTGPALDLGPETEGDDLLSAVPAFGVATMQDENSFAHVEASSGTRQAFKTSHIGYEKHPVTVDPRELAARPKPATIDTTPRTRDSDAPATSQGDTSIATTEVIPSGRNDTASEKTVSPPLPLKGYMLGAKLLQGLRTESAAEAVKSRSRSKAKPLALASKEERAAIKGYSPPRRSPNEKSTSPRKGSKADSPSNDEDEDDELRLTSKKSSKSGSSKTSLERDKGMSRVVPGRVIEIDSDDDDSKKKPETQKRTSTSNKKGKQRVESEEDDPEDDGGKYYDLDDERLQQDLREAEAREEEEDDDYDGGKGTSKDRWNKRTKKDNQRKSAKASSEEPASKGKTRSTKVKGQPSAVYPTSRKGKSRTVADDDPESDEPVQVGTVRKTSRTSKKDQAKSEKPRPSKGPEPRSKEFLDEEDMADDQVTTSWSQMHAPILPHKSMEPTIDDAAAGSLAVTGNSPPASNGGPITKRPKPAKTYGRKANQSKRRVEDSEDEESEGMQTSKSRQVHGSQGQASTSREASAAVAGEILVEKERSTSHRAPDSRSERSNSPAYAVIIDNSAKKTRALSSKMSKPLASKGREVEPGPIKKDDSTGGEAPPTLSPPKDLPARKKAGAAARIADSEEDESEDNESEDNCDASKAQEQPERAQVAAVEEPSAEEKSTIGTKNGKSNVLQSKDQNVHLSAQRAVKDVKQNTVSTPARVFKSNSGLSDIKPAIGSTGKRFHDMVVAKGGGQGIRPQGLSKRGLVPALLSFRGVPPPKKPPLPPAPVRKKKKGEEVYSDDDQEELNDQPEEWWDADDYYAWEQRKRKRAKAKGDIDSEEEQELAQKHKKMKREASPVPEEGHAMETEHLSD